MLFLNCHRGGQITTTKSIFSYFFLCLVYNLLDKYATSFDFVVFVVVVAVAFIVVRNRHSGMDGYVVISLGALIYLGGMRSGGGWCVLGGVSWC